MYLVTCNNRLVMALGKVKSMYNNMARKVTPNSGILTDVDTGVEYAFSRPAVTGTMTKWNVQVHDYVSFTVSNGEAIDVTLYKRHINGLVIDVL